MGLKSWHENSFGRAPCVTVYFHCQNDSDKEFCEQAHLCQGRMCQWWSWFHLLLGIVGYLWHPVTVYASSSCGNMVNFCEPRQVAPQTEECRAVSGLETRWKDFSCRSNSVTRQLSQGESSHYPFRVGIDWRASDTYDQFPWVFWMLVGPGFLTGRQGLCYLGEAWKDNKTRKNWIKPFSLKMGGWCMIWVWESHFERKFRWVYARKYWHPHLLWLQVLPDSWEDSWIFSTISAFQLLLKSTRFIHVGVSINGGTPSHHPF